MVDPDRDESDPPDGCVAAWCADDDWCAVTCTLDVVGNKWHPVIVVLLLDDEPLGFSALQERMDGVTAKVLSESLDALVGDGIVERRVVSEHPRRVEYSLTEAGAALEPVVDAMAEWGERYLSEGGFGNAGETCSDADAGEAGTDGSLDGDDRSEDVAGRQPAVGHEFDE